MSENANVKTKVIDVKLSIAKGEGIIDWEAGTQGFSRKAIGEGNWLIAAGLMVGDFVEIQREYHDGINTLITGFQLLERTRKAE